VRYLAGLDWSSEIEFLGGWTAEKLYRLKEYYEDRYTPRQQIMDTSQIHKSENQAAEPADALLRIRCPGCQKKDKAYLVLTKKPEGRGRKRTGGIPYIRCVDCAGAMLGTKMVARYLGMLRWSKDVVVGRWTLQDLAGFTEKWA
jgi:hypothetical protein